MALSGLVLGAAAQGAPQQASIAPSRDLNPCPSTYHPLPSGPVVLTGATIFDGAGRRVENGDVLVANGKIIAVGHSLARPANPP